MIEARRLKNIVNFFEIIFKFKLSFVTLSSKTCAKAQKTAVLSDNENS